MQNSPLHVPKYDHAVFASKALSRSKRQPFSVRATIFPFGEQSVASRYFELCAE